MPDWKEMLVFQFVNGTANFTNLAITHNGTGYQILYNVTYPTSVSFSVTYGVHVIKERDLGFIFQANITDAAATFRFLDQPSVYVYDKATGEKITNVGWKGREWLLKAELVKPEESNATLSQTIVKLQPEFGRFHNLSVNKAGDSFQIILTVSTIPPSKYISEPFHSNIFNVLERTYNLKMQQQPGDCNETVICGIQPIVEVWSNVPEGIAIELNWDKHTWHIEVDLCDINPSNPLKGPRKLPIPRSGIVQFANLYFDDVGTDYLLCFNLTVNPSEPKYENVTLKSSKFNIKQRIFYLELDTPPLNITEWLPFAQQPIITVRDMGTGLLAIPLKGAWTITVSISKGVNGATLSGTKTVTVQETVAKFTDLVISHYGNDFVLEFKSNYGQMVNTFCF